MTQPQSLVEKLKEWRQLANRPDLTWAEWKGEEAQLASALIEACDALGRLMREQEAARVLPESRAAGEALRS